MNSLKTPDSKLYAMAMGFISRRYPNEAPFFDVVWEHVGSLAWTFRGSASARQVERVCAGLPFDAEDGGFLASPFVVLTLRAVFAELRARGVAPDTTRTGKAILESALAFGTPKRVAEQLAAELSARMSEYLRASCADGPSCLDEGRGDRSATASASSQEDTLARPYRLAYCWRISSFDEAVVGMRRSQGLDAVMEFMRQEYRPVTWLLDERGPEMVVSGERIAWDRVDARHRILLGMILLAFEKREYVLPYVLVARRALQIKDAIIKDDLDKVTRLRRDLNRIMLRTLDDSVVPDSGMEQFCLKSVVSYCWVRLENGFSRLLHPNNHAHKAR